MRHTFVRVLGVALSGLALTGATACAKAKPIVLPRPVATTSPTVVVGITESAGSSASSPAPSVSQTGSPGPVLVPACAAALKARQTAADALSPVSAVLVQSGLFHDDLTKATRDLMAAFTALHAALGSAAELTGDARLKAKIAAYQLTVEQGIVDIESSDSEQPKLKAIIASPKIRSAADAVVAACS